MSQTGKHTQDLKEYERRTRRTSGHIQCKPQEPTSLHAKRSAEPAATDQYLRSSSLVQQSGLVNMNHATSRMMLALVAAGILVLFLVFAILDAPSIRPPWNFMIRLHLFHSSLRSISEYACWIPISGVSVCSSQKKFFHVAPCANPSKTLNQKHWRWATSAHSLSRWYNRSANKYRVRTPWNRLLLQIWKWRRALSFIA